MVAFLSLHLCITQYLFQDPFGDVIKKIMDAIHTHAQLSTPCDLGSQNYEQWVVQIERKGEYNLKSIILNLGVFCPT